MTMSFDYDVIVLGAGSGGLIATIRTRKLGMKVLLVESEKMGGDCLNYGCVPSKSFLKSAHLAKKINESSKFGLKNHGFDVDMKNVMGYVQSIVKEIEPHDSKERYESHFGATVILGKGVIKSSNSVEVDGEIYTTKKIIVATGSTAYIPPIKGLENVQYYTNLNIFNLEYRPRNMIVLGAGTIGLELGQGFRHLGSEVHMIDMAENIFAKDEPEVQHVMKEQLETEGVHLHLGCVIEEIVNQGEEIAVHIRQGEKRIKIVADTLLVALGRRPNTDNMGLEACGVKRDAKGYILVDEYLQSSVDGIFAIGDCIGGYMFTQAAGYEATVAAKNAVLGLESKVEYYNMSWCTYTVPEVAHVGYLEKDAKKEDVWGSTEMVPIGNHDRSKAEDDRLGFIKVILDKEDKVVGATIVGECAGEMLPIYSLMVTQRMNMNDLLGVIYPYPTRGELVKMLANRSK